MKVNTRPGQWIGIAVVLLVTGFFGFVVPRLAPSVVTENVQVTEVAAGTRVSEGIVSVVPGEGWSQSTEVPGLLLLKRPEAVMLFAAPEPADGRSVTDVVTKNAEVFTSMDADPSRTIGEAEPFTTSSGLDGATLLVQDTATASFLGAVTDGTTMVTVSLNSDPSAWTEVSKDIDAVMSSIEIGAAGTEDGS